MITNTIGFTEFVKQFRLSTYEPINRLVRVAYGEQANTSHAAEDYDHSV